MTARIKRHPSRQSYTVTPNAAINDARLSWKALGLLVYMLSLPDDWLFNHSHLGSKRGKHGSMRRASASAISELRSAGYVHITAHREGGRFKEWVWYVSDFPVESPPEAHFADLENADLQNRRVQKKKPTNNPPSLSRTPCASAGASPAGGWEDYFETRGWNDRDASRLEVAVARHGEDVVKQKARDMQTAAGRRPFVSELVGALEELRSHSNTTPGRRGAGQPAGGTPARKGVREGGYELLAKLAQREVEVDGEVVP